MKNWIIFILSFILVVMAACWCQPENKTQQTQSTNQILTMTLTTMFPNTKLTNIHQLLTTIFQIVYI